MRPNEYYDPLSESKIGYDNCNPGWEQEVEDEYEGEEKEIDDNDKDVEDTVNPPFKRQYMEVDQDVNLFPEGFQVGLKKHMFQWVHKDIIIENWFQVVECGAYKNSPQQYSHACRQARRQARRQVRRQVRR